MNMYVSPILFCRSISRFNICACMDTSRADTGSSQTINSVQGKSSRFLLSSGGVLRPVHADRIRRTFVVKSDYVPSALILFPQGPFTRYSLHDLHRLSDQITYGHTWI